MPTENVCKTFIPMISFVRQIVMINDECSKIACKCDQKVIFVQMKYGVKYRLYVLEMFFD